MTRTRRPDGYYDDFEILSKDILQLKTKIGRFPNKEEILTHLKIGYRYLKKHGGMYEIKRKLNVFDERNKFIDNSGFYNNSSYEMIVANFLIENNVPYLREQQIVKNHKFRSDFTVYNQNDKPIHVELWGFLKSNNTKVGLEYNEVREIKEQLYKDHYIEYLSIEPTIFYKKNYNNMQESLMNIFELLINNHNLKFVKQDVLIPSYEHLDEEILQIALSYSHDINYLPEANIFREKHMGLYNQILKRYETYNNFAEKFNKKLLYKSNGYWNINKVFAIYDHMIEKFGKILSRNEVKQNKDTDEKVKDYSSIVASLDKMFEGFANLKIKYYAERINKGLPIPQDDFHWLQKATINKTRRGNMLVTIEQQEQARLILEKYINR
jgi:hypothetical protein